MPETSTSRVLTRRGLVASSVAVGAALALPAQAASVHAPDPLDLGKYRGKVVYLDFWASWCGPCRLSFPYMERLSAYYAAKPFALIAVNVDHSRERADAFIAAFGPNINVVYDPEGQVALKYGVREMPTSVVLDKNGHVRFTHNGFYEAQEPTYQEHVVELLNEA